MADRCRKEGIRCAIWRVGVVEGQCWTPIWMVRAHGRVAAQASNFATYVVGRVESGFVYRSGKEKTRPKEHDYKTLPPPDTVELPSSRRGT